MKPNASVFIAMKQRKSNDEIFGGMCTKEVYFYAKAVWVVNIEEFYGFWQDGRSKALLTQVLKDHYPPLKDCHEQKDGYEGLDEYVAVAKTIM